MRREEDDKQMRMNTTNTQIYVSTWLVVVDCSATMTGEEGKNRNKDRAV